jgi:hypothetical protein
MRPSGMQHAATITTVTADFRVGNRIGYQVRVSCGCSFWMYADPDQPPAIGTSMTCHNPEHSEGNVTFGRPVLKGVIR